MTTQQMTAATRTFADNLSLLAAVVERHNLPPAMVIAVHEDGSLLVTVSQLDHARWLDRFGHGHVVTNAGGHASWGELANGSKVTLHTFVSPELVGFERQPDPIAEPTTQAIIVEDAKGTRWQRRGIRWMQLAKGHEGARHFQDSRRSILWPQMIQPARVVHPSQR